MSKRSSALPPSRPGAPSLTYAEWRKRAREKFAGPTTMREKARTHLYITGKTPDEAAYQANIYYRQFAGAAEAIAHPDYGRPDDIGRDDAAYS